MNAISLTVWPLTKERFAAFGDVVETDGADHFAINDGMAERYHDLATVDVDAEGGRPLVNVFRGQPWTFPIAIEMLERHPLGSQTFMPLTRLPFLVVVADSGEGDAPGMVHAFLSEHGQGVSYHRNVWHHPLLALEATADFLVIDRGGPGDNLQEHRFEQDAGYIIDATSIVPRG
ncbi:MAG: ureidoglycolate lyase [Hyphomicrobiales bacterium]